MIDRPYHVNTSLEFRGCFQTLLIHSPVKYSRTERRLTGELYLPADFWIPGMSADIREYRCTRTEMDDTP